MVYCWPRFTREELIAVGTLAVVTFLTFSCASLHTPLYTSEAEKKGLTVEEYDLMLGIYQLITFVSCPIFGKYVGKLGAKNLLQGGMVTTGFGCFLLGFVTLVKSRTGFLTLSCLALVVESLGAAASMTACVTIVAIISPGSVATMFGSLEGFRDVGFALGPLLGEILFELGGFIIPFTVIGCLLVLIGLSACLVSPKMNDGLYTNRPPADINSVLTLPLVVFAVYSVATATVSMSYYETLLERHLDKINSSSLETEVLEAITEVTYSSTAPLVGRLCNTRLNPTNVTLIGSLLAVVSSLLLGLTPLFPLRAKFWVNCVGLMLQGLEFSCLTVSSLVGALRSAFDAGLPEDITTYGIVSGLLCSSFCLGSFTGPFVAEQLYETFGFHHGSLVLLSTHSVLFLGLASVLWLKQRNIGSFHLSHEPENTINVFQNTVSNDCKPQAEHV